jgi:hypothetical protein
VVPWTRLETPKMEDGADIAGNFYFPTSNDKFSFRNQLPTGFPFDEGAHSADVTLNVWGIQLPSDESLGLCLRNKNK